MMYANAVALGKAVWLKLYPGLEVPNEFVSPHREIVPNNFDDDAANMWDALNQDPCDRHGVDLLYAEALRNFTH
jgi:hypothetical protein